MTLNVEFRPYKRKDGRYSFQIFIDGEPEQRWIWFIESTNWVIATVAGPEGGDLTCGSVYSLEECQGNCNWLNSRLVIKEKNKKILLAISKEGGQ